MVMRYETRQSSLLYFFILCLGLDPAQNNNCLLRTEELTNRAVLVVTYQTRETVFHRDIQTPNTTRSGYF